MNYRTRIFSVIFLFVVLLTTKAFCERLTIEKCIEIARENNLDFKMKKNSFDISKIKEEQSKLKYLPTLSAVAGKRRNAYTDDIPEESNKYDLVMVQPLYHFGEISNNIRAARSGKNAARFDVIESEIQLEKLVYQSYLDILRSKKLLFIKENSIVKAATELKYINEQIDDGERGSEAGLRWRVLLNSYEDDLIKIKHNLRRSYIVINLLMERDSSKPLSIAPIGKEAFDYDKMTFDELRKTLTFDEIVNVLFDYALVFKPALKRSKEEIEKSRHLLNAERSGNYPKIDFVPEYNADGQEFPQWTYSLRVKFMFLNPSDWKGVEIKEKQLKNTRLQGKILLRNIKSQIKDRLSKLLSSIQQVHVNSKRTKESAEYLAKIIEKYHEDKATDVEMVDAFKSYYEALESQTDALYNYYHERAEVNAIIGYSEYRQTPTILSFYKTKDKTKFRVSLSIDEGGEIFKAANACNLKKVKDFLEKNPRYLNYQNPDGWTPLHFSAYTDDIKMAEYLIKKGAKLNLQTTIGMTPLYVATTQGNPKMVKLLIDNGADVNTPAGRPTRSPLMRAVMKKFDKIAEMLIAAGANVNARSEMGWTALHCAAENGSVKMIKMLIKAGAKIDIKNDEGLTPLQIAQINGRDAAEEVLKEAEKKSGEGEEVIEEKKN